MLIKINAGCCNPSYSGGREQEDGGLKKAQENTSARHHLKNTHHGKDWRMAQDKGSEFISQYHKK
jgi:hypothetical protein